MDCTRRAVMGLALLAGGCWPDSGLPSGPGGTCNNNNVCECDLGEDALSCGDCDACRAICVRYSQQVDSPTAALGEPDGKYATLKPGSELRLEVGTKSSSNIELVGDVLSNSTTTISSLGCSGYGPVAGGFHVQVSDDDSSDSYLDMGQWTLKPGGTGAMKFMCVDGQQVPPILYIRIRADISSPAQARLDGVKISGCN